MMAERRFLNLLESLLSRARYGEARRMVADRLREMESPFVIPGAGCR